MGDEVTGWTAPLYAALTAPRLLAGVPQSFFVLLFGGTMALGLHWPLCFVVGAVLYGVVRMACRYDTDCVAIVTRHLNYRAHYRG